MRNTRSAKRKLNQIPNLARVFTRLRHGLQSTSTRLHATESKKRSHYFEFLNNEQAKIGLVRSPKNSKIGAYNFICDKGIIVLCNLERNAVFRCRALFTIFM